MANSVPTIFDRSLYLHRQSKASADARAPIDAQIAMELADRLSIVTRTFDTCLLIAPTNILNATHHMQPGVSDDLVLQPNSVAAIFNLLDLQTINDVPGYLAQLATALQPDGLLMLAFFAGDTLFELRQSWLVAETEITGGASPRVAPMISVRELGGLLQRAGLALPVADIDRHTVRYSDAFALMRDVKKLGFSNPLVGRSSKFVSRRLLTKVAEHYHANFADADGRIRATIEVAWANAWKPHPSQPQPLKPGSAKARLADALKTMEIKT
jgi:hypothetical protein